MVRLGVLVSGRRGIKKRVIRGDKGEKIRMATQDELRHLYEKQNLKSLIMPAGEEAVKEGRDESVAIIDMPEEGDNEKAEDQFGGETFVPIEEE